MILDTNGLSALAEGEPGLEPFCAEQRKLPFLSLFWVNTGTDFAVSQPHSL